MEIYLHASIIQLKPMVDSNHIDFLSSWLLILLLVNNMWGMPSQQTLGVNPLHSGLSPLNKKLCKIGYAP